MLLPFGTGDCAQRPCPFAGPIRWAHSLERLAIEAAAHADDEVFAGFRRFERELLMEYMRMAIANARRLDDPSEQGRS